MVHRFSVALLLALSVISGAVFVHTQHAGNNYSYDDDYDEQPPWAPKPTYTTPPTQHLRPTPPSVLEVPGFGNVLGKWNYKTIKNRDINSFLGLKYGKVGAGLGRFQPATVPEPPQGDAIINATQEPVNCPQFPDLQKIAAAEARGENVDDCLTLNIHAPSRVGSYPVMVFIHGEMLFDGSAEEGQPDYFLEHDVVLVTINYRLAPFGFVTTLTDELPGNVALADITLALEWVQKHIRAFGGHPGEVTLYGQAGGATLAHALAISGKAEGLFHKLILQSGTALNPYFLDEEPLETVRAFLRHSRCPPGGRIEAHLIRCVERMRTSELLQAFERYWEESERLGLRATGGFKLSIGDRLGFLPQHPAALVARNTYPIIAGVAKDAGAFIMSRFYDQLKNLRTRNITEYINIVLTHTAQPRHHAIWRNLALREIFTDDTIRNPTEQNVAQGLLELTNLILYRGPLVDSIRFTYKKHRTYLYCFGYRGQYHRFGHLTNPLPFEADATLSDDNIYFFPYPVEVSQLNAEDMSIARAMTTMWVNFARHNVPNFNAGIWPNVTSEYGPFLRISNSMTNALELDVHFGEGIPVPNLYPEYFYNATITTTTTTTTQRPSYPTYRPLQPYRQTVLNGTFSPPPNYPYLRYPAHPTRY